MPKKRIPQQGKDGVDGSAHSAEPSLDEGSDDTVWYLAIKKLHIVQGPGSVPSSIRFYPGQRFALDGDEFVDIEDLLRLRAVKIYEDSDEGWAKQRIAEIPQKPKRRRNRG
jgi:hypothetical protein